jgi:O-antigen/teichoic acid export membrane protein
MFGQGVGLIVALFAIPILLKNLGQAAFGIFSICLVLIGFSGLLDLGIGRAVTSKIAQATASKNQIEATSTTTAALLILTLVGLALGVIIFISATQASNILIGSSKELLGEAIKSLYLLAITAPFALLSSGLRGVLEGLQDFKVIAKITIPSGVMMFAAPAAISYVVPTVSHAIFTLLIVRVATMIAFFIACRRRMNLIQRDTSLVSRVRELLHAGGWMTVSNVVSPVMTNLDRVFISAIISPAAATIHVTAYELASKALLPAGSIANASYPVFSSLADDENREAQKRYFWRAMSMTSVASVVPALILYFLAERILSLWISPEFAAGGSSEILMLFAIGVCVNGLAFIPFAYVQGIGRADVAAKFHLLELFFFVPALLLALDSFGVKGAAVAWVGRVLLDAALLFYYAMRKLS